MFKKLYWFLFVYDLDNALGNTPFDAGEWSWKGKLKRDLSYMVLGSYIFFIFSSAMPVFADIVAHTFWEKEHLLTVHQANGKYHVHFQIRSIEKQSGKDKATGNSKFGSENAVHLITNLVYNFSNTHLTRSYYSICLFNYSFFYTYTHYRPPLG